ncbi:MAG: hypothetical protein JW751_15190 [Polyangiaceae bacterium]|nr:hypothetical protein [Polyangiaceae bacterium]
MLTAGLLLGCASSPTPTPEAATRQFAAAAKQGDADAIYELMTSEAQRAHGREGTQRLVDGSRDELAGMGQELAAGELAVETEAVVRFSDGERAELSVEDGEFRIELADVLPTRASTPEAALGALRVALARRSYAALYRLLSNETRASIERDLDTLVEGLEDPETLDVKTDEDEASVALPGGHVVRLRREDGAWRVEGVD